MDSKFFEKIEYQGLKKLYQSSPRNPRQQNSFNTSDTEVVQLKKDLFLVSSTDSMAVEIHSGLYKHPETWGYLAVANSVSDLAASGASPIGMLISAQWKKAHAGRVKNQVYKSMAKALKTFGIPLLGGDSGMSNETVLTTTILGQSSVTPLTRVGIKPGDVVIAFGNFLGFGPVLAFDYLRNQSRNKWEISFRPYPKWQITHRFRKHLKAAIDSSDGIYNSLSTLAEVNNVGFKISCSKFGFSKKINSYRLKHDIPVRYFIESDLGDLQTCAVIDPIVYNKIKLRLPTHLLIATADNNSKRVSYSDDTQSETRIEKYVTLPSVLERKNFNYSSSLNLWMRQFSK